MKYHFDRLGGTPVPEAGAATIAMGATGNVAAPAGDIAAPGGNIDDDDGFDEVNLAAPVSVLCPAS